MTNPLENGQSQTGEERPGEEVKREDVQSNPMTNDVQVVELMRRNRGHEMVRPRRRLSFQREE
jgi:hypothetical protein